jgi:hypothetical protein
VSEFESPDFTTDEPVKTEREGLPAGYRMRADPHYVELLSGARGERARADSRTAVRELDAAPQPARSTRDRRVFDQLIEDISAIESAAAMLSGDSSALARRVSLDLIKAQAARASWMVRSQALLAGAGGESLPRYRQVGALLGQVRERLAAECRLVGVGLQVSTENQAAVTIDDQLVTLGVSGAVTAVLPMLAGIEGAVIRIEAIVEDDADEDVLEAVEVSQDAILVPPSARARFFEGDFVDRPGGWLAATGAAVAQSAAERLGGRATLVAGSRRGCTIRMGFA